MEIFSSSQLVEIAHQFGTPIWVYSAEQIRKNIRELKCFDTIRYAQKAASNLNILRLMKDEGVMVDSVSLGELARSLRVGFDPKAEEVIFTADLIDFSTLETVIEKGITVNAGSLDMLRRIGEHSPGHRVWVRINPGFGHGHCNKTNTGGPQSKHGIWHTDLPEVIEIVEKYELKLIGIHMHIGSGVDYEHLTQVCKSMMNVIESVDVGGLRNLEAISAGGGLTVPYEKDEPEMDIQQYFSQWDEMKKLVEKVLNKKIQLEVEPGRFLVANAGVLVTQVHSIQHRPKDAADFILVDAGFNDLMRPSMYGSYHGMSVISQNDTKDRPIHEYAVAGPLCESGDVFTQHEGGIVTTRHLPQAQVGDFLVIHTTGAYGASMSSNYNSRPLAAEVLVESDGTARLIRKRQRIEDLINLEQKTLKIEDDLFNRYQYKLGDDEYRRALWAREQLCDGKDRCSLVPPFIEYESRQMIAPKFGISSCVIYKNFSTVMTSIICYIYDIFEYETHVSKLIADTYVVRFCKGKNEYTSFRAFKNMKPGIHQSWTNFVLVREPTERFLSGFINKCIGDANRENPCYNCDKNITCVLERQYESLQQIAQGKKFWHTVEDSHFAPQSWHCEMRNNYQNYTFIQYNSANTEEMINGLMNRFEELDVPLNVTANIANQVLSGRTFHATYKSKHRKRYEDEIRSSPYLRKLLTQMFFYDYILFQFPLPSF
ncbi:unnamed protein product, partial [Mesorhabditis belari]|uniref:Orn/DAP/Arg decarboxylase 2 N-terminal domain-containing protein n=1 Tax=Mesorhabditis belari TaxID=2138241 RepID=A0AAF3EMH4_9BILA